MKTPREYTAKGETHTIREWSKIVDIPIQTIRTRLRYGWDFDRAISTKSKPQKNRVYKGRCTAKSVQDCFDCQFDDCIRSTEVPGERSFRRENINR